MKFLYVTYVLNPDSNTQPRMRTCALPGEEVPLLRAGHLGTLDQPRLPLPTVQTKQMTQDQLEKRTLRRNGITVRHYPIQSLRSPPIGDPGSA